MKSQTSVVAEQTRLRSWAELIKDCQSRPKGMTIETWCQQNGIKKDNYYYRLRRVRQACLNHVEDHEAQFVELPAPVSHLSQVTETTEGSRNGEIVAVLRGQNNFSIEIYSSATPDLIKLLIGAIAYAQ